MSLRNSCVSAWEVLPVTIPNGACITDEINLGGLRLFGISVPAAWTAANLTFQMSHDGGTTWADLHDQNGSEITAMADAGCCIMLTPYQFAPIEYIRVRSGPASNPVNQGADRSLKLVLRSV